MSTPAFEKFCAGEDRLAAVLRALPAFEPPAHMAEVFAAHVRSLAPAPAVAAAADTMFFEPPASLAAAVGAEAARLHAAQAPRRDAALQQIAAGASSADVLGAAVGADSERWLAAQAALAARAAQVAEQKAAANTARRTWWRNMQWVAASAAVAAVFTTLATQFILQQEPGNAETPVAQLSPSTPDSLSAPVLAANDAAKRAPATEARASRDSIATTGAGAAPAEEARRARSDAFSNERETQGSKEAPALSEQKALAMGEEPKKREELALADASNVAEKLAAREIAAGQPQGGLASASVAVPAAEPAQPAPEASASALAKAAPRVAAAAPPMPAPAPAPAAAPAAPAAARPAAPAASASAQRQAPPAHVFSLNDAPGSVLQQIGGWQTQHRLWVRDPADPATQAWVEALRMAIPEASRPATLPVIGDPGFNDGTQVIVVPGPETPAR